MQVNVAEAKAKLSELIARAERGEEVVIARSGRPVITLTAVQPRANRRTPGLWAQLLPDMPDDLFTREDADTAAAVATWEREPLCPGDR